MNDKGAGEEPGSEPMLRCFMGSEVKLTTQFRVIAMPLFSHIVLSHFSLLSEPQFTQMYNGDSSIHLIELSKELKSHYIVLE